jgi:hypothetical protein
LSGGDCRFWFFQDISSLDPHESACQFGLYWLSYHSWSVQFLAAGIRDDYQHKLFHNKLSKILEKFLEQNNLFTSIFYGLAIELFPEKSTVVSLLAEQQDFKSISKEIEPVEHKNYNANAIYRCAV